MKRLLFVGDSPACPSGFGHAARETLDFLRYTYDITVLGINGNGDPHDLPYPIYLAAAGGDAFGLGRLIWMCDLVHPDIILLQNDPWNIPRCLEILAKFPEYRHVPVVASMAVDGKNLSGRELNNLTFAIFWTQFALDEARAGGLTVPAAVIPLGVDLEKYYPADKHEARFRCGLPPYMDDAFIVGNVNRNQPRKRWDLTIKYFAEWVTSYKIDNTYLYLHVAPTGDTGVDVKQLAKYYGILNRIALREPPTFYGITEDAMRDTYNSFDLQITTTQGEGFGLTNFEGMACGVPQIVPDWSALGELMKGAAWQVKCTSTAIGMPYVVNVIGGVPDQELFIQAMNTLYHNPAYRQQNREAGLERVRLPRYRWPNIGQAFVDVLDSLTPQQQPKPKPQEILACQTP